MGIYYSLFEQLKDVNKTKGLHVKIPEIERARIINKDLEVMDDSLVMETVLIVKDSSDTYFYTIFKFRNIKNEWSELSSINNHLGLKESWITSMKSNDITINDLHPKAKYIDFHYRYSLPPLSFNTLSDTIFIQKFESNRIEVSLTEKNRNDLYIKKKKPFKLILYKHGNNLYLILAELTFKDKDNKWISDTELKKTLYPLVKNWGIYEKR